ncbi:MAG TPA: hydantoinase/oxoprolinase family protein [bacterium]|nr:hydantoinase/oxoprolinase family protein [bacterium]
MKRVGIDVGGTFTDLVVYDEETRRLSRSKVFSTPKNPEEGVLAAMAAAAVEPAELSYLIHGTTLVTNLILERSGCKVGFITTAGFRDVLEIMRASRPRPYDLSWTKPAPIVPRHLRAEVRERVNHRGEVLEPLDLVQAASIVERFIGQGVEAIAVCFLHSYTNPIHERLMADLVRRRSSIEVTISSDVCREIREYERASTVSLNAYSIRRISAYVESLEKKLPVSGGIRYMNSEGGVIPGAEAKRSPVTLALSGPAGGVLAGQFLARALHLPNVITMDMGGTSLDVCAIQDGMPQLDRSISVEWGIPMQVPAIQIHTIGAGGGSVAWIDEGGGLQIGPESAGSAPGPACYGKGGERPTVTDANLILGLLNPEYFLGGRVRIDPDKALQALRPLCRHYGLSAGDVADGVYRLTNARMAQAIREITVEKGLDPRDFTLVSFGGAGGQHAIAVAREASISSVLLPLAPSVFSAFGMITADVRASRSRTFIQPLESLSAEDIHAMFRDLEAEAKMIFDRDSAPVTQLRYVDLRYRSQSHEVAIPAQSGDTPQDLYVRFEDRHLQLYGSKLGDPVDLITIRSTAVQSVDPIHLPEAPGARAEGPTPVAFRSISAHRDALPVFRRDELGGGMTVPTPSIVEEIDTTHYLPSSCAARIDRYGNIMVALT